ncbi:iron complex transport system ATP-binding protein [Thermocatellispora tengchongensis]|uniref:Iron complex transport system ATP-binding protein n=1 Tax=Thermocatellispora tengchongensis TaxID=1073253 RepID=A0A840PC05_9ACTN|nr:ABC transporter ATP-binding protein [Thermocatellispora tengchongensis]MBB5134960.1 iron complex transport system ATP-binding protein [Thermocatellispora tengchongensis]
MKLEVENVSWLGVLRGVSLTALPGEVVGLIGPNGSGKSSLLRCVYRRIRPDDGRVLLDGADVWRTPAREVARQVAVVAQDTPADLDETVEHVVALGRIPHLGALGRLSAAEVALIAETMERCDVAALARRPVATLSGGERQRVQLARALVQRPRLLVLDEPTNHLDLRHQVELLRLIRTLGVTVVVTLHDLQLAAAACDRLVVLDAGRVVADGSAAEVVTEKLLREVYQVHAEVAPGADGLPRLFLPLGRAPAASPPL